MKKKKLFYGYWLSCHDWAKDGTVYVSNSLKRLIQFFFKTAEENFEDGKPHQFTIHEEETGERVFFARKWQRFDRWCVVDVPGYFFNKPGLPEDKPNVIEI